MKKIIIGARGSKLSLAYANRVKKLILKKNSYLSDAMIEIRPITTSGDIFHDKKLSEIGGKNLFCKEIEEALLQNKIDIAIHSLKDMASEEIESLHIGAYIERNDPREALVSLKFNNIKQLDAAIIGSSSRRRNLQLQLINKNILVKNIRGNIDTRIQKLKEGGFDAIILALAGLKSLELEQHAKQIFSTSEMLPAVGQGIIAAQCKKENKEITEILKAVDHHETRVCAIAERNLLKVLGGDCDTAVGGFARLEGQYIILSSQLFSDSGSEAFYHEVKGKIEDAESIGYTVATELLKKQEIILKKLMNILITRPLIDAEDMMQKLFSSGHKIFHLPTLKITSNNSSPINSDDYDAFIFTSANAIRHLNLKNNNKKIQCFCVGTMTEKIARQNGFTNTISAGGTVNALKNLILISDKVNKKSKLAYFCGDHISYDLEGELKKEGFQIDKIINYQSTKITELNNENKNLLDQYPPDLVYIYSLRSAESFIDIVKNYSLTQLMTHSKVMCISEKIAKAFKLVGWNKIEVFNPGEELLRI